MMKSKSKPKEMSWKEKEKFFGIVIDLVKYATIGDETKDEVSYLYSTIQDKVKLSTANYVRELAVVIQSSEKKDLELLHSLLKST